MFPSGDFNLGDINHSALGLICQALINVCSDSNLNRMAHEASNDSTNSLHLVSVSDIKYLQGKDVLNHDAVLTLMDIFPQKYVCG